MRVLLLIMLAVFSGSAASADHKARLLKIDCEPSVGQFSMRPTSTWSWGEDYPDGYVDVEQGLERNANTNEITQEPGFEVFATCVLSLFNEGLVFEVVRTTTSRSISLNAYYGVSIDFRLNGEVLATGYAHSKGGYWMPTLLYDAEGLTVCQIDEPSFDPHQPPVPSSFDKHCEWISSEQLLERIKSK